MYTFTSSICFSSADRDNFAYVYCSSLFFQGRKVWLFQSRRLWLYICWMFIVQCLLMFVIHYIEPRVFPNTKLHFLRACITSAGVGSELLWAESKTLQSVRNITAKLAYLVMIKMQVFWKWFCVVRRTAWPWSWRQYHTSKRRKTDAHWHCVTPQHLLYYHFFVSWRCQVRISDWETVHPVVSQRRFRELLQIY